MQKKEVNNNSLQTEVKSYYEFSIFISLHQLITVPTRLTCNRATIIDHILASYPERVTQQGSIHVGFFDHQLIFCTKNISRITTGRHKHIKFRLFKYSSIDLFKETLTKIDFFHFQTLNDATEAYHDFIEKIMGAMDKVTLLKKEG